MHEWQQDWDGLKNGCVGGGSGGGGGGGGGGGTLSLERRVGGFGHRRLLQR